VEIVLRRVILRKCAAILFFVVFLFAQSVFAAEPFRTIAILENERMLEAEPDMQLAHYFQSQLEPVRIRALLAAGRIGNPEVLRDVQSLARDKSSEVRKYLAFALGQIRSKKGLSLALTLLKDPNAEVRRVAIEAIGRIGGMEATEILLPFLTDEIVRLREQAALALALIKDRGTVDMLIERSRGNDPAQWSYVYALYRLADERSVQVLHYVLANPVASSSTGDPSSLLFALKALWAMKKPLTALEVQTLMQHKDARVQQNVLDVISASLDKTACSAIHRYYKSMEVLTKMKALEAMGSLECVIPERPINSGLLGAWIVANAKANKGKSLQLLQEGMRSQDWTVRWRTSQGLSELPAATAIPLLKMLIQDTDSAVRLAALESLAKHSLETADIFLPLLQDKDFAIRATAADALGKTKDPRYLPALLKAYEHSTDPTEIEGRVALLDVLSEFQTSDVIPLFERALLDPEYSIRRHAVDGIKKLIGAQYYRNGAVKDPEEYLYLRGKVSKARQEQYPRDFGESQPESEILLKLTKGDVVVRFLGADAPIHVSHFTKLMRQDFYNGLRIHRVVPNFVIQGGDPRGDGWGGGGEVLHDQFNLREFKRGMVGMPTAGKDTGGSQFFITHSRQPHLDGNYTIFGEVISGMDVVDRTEVGDEIVSVTLRPRTP
jgi:cyclophilin family peptidyl-prolyl cis-trans isomerase/HEAT repeat protein